jgi:hypothetical protein
MSYAGFNGEWSDPLREIAAQNEAWIRGVDIGIALSHVRTKAQMADTDQTKASLVELRHALERLDRACQIQQNQAKRLRDEVAMLIAAVHAKHSVHVDPVPADNGIPHEDELLERMSDLYGLPKPRARR